MNEGKFNEGIDLRDEPRESVDGPEGALAFEGDRVRGERSIERKEITRELWHAQEFFDAKLAGSAPVGGDLQEMINWFENIALQVEEQFPRVRIGLKRPISAIFEEKTEIEDDVVMRTVDEQSAIERTETFVGQIKTPEIQAAAPSLFNLAKKVLEAKKEYDLILSDDAGGRLVSLFMKHILDSVQKENGLPKPDISFIASGRKNRDVFGAMKEMLEGKSSERTLLVTEYIESGDSIKRIADVLDELKMKFDIAVMEAYSNVSLVRVEESFGKGTDSGIYYGSLQSHSPHKPLLYRSYDLTGVKKRPHHLFPRAFIKDYVGEDLFPEKTDRQNKVNQAREDISLLARETLKELRTSQK